MMCFRKVCYILPIYFVTNLITVSNGMESNSPGDVMKDEDSRLKDIQEMIDSNLVGRIPLCTYVINDGSLPGLEKTGSSGNESSPIIHPEFGCVSCKLELQKACHTAPSEIKCEDDIPEIRRKLKNKLRSSQQSNTREELQPVYRPNLSGRTCDPCPPVPRKSVSAASDTINCRYEDDGEEEVVHQESASENIESYNDNISNERIRPKRKIQFETKCREFTPSCGGTDSVNFQKDCQPRIVCYKKPKVISRRRRNADADPKIRKLCRKRLVIKKRKNPNECNCTPSSFPGSSNPSSMNEELSSRHSRQLEEALQHQDLTHTNKGLQKVDSPFGPLTFVNPLQGGRRTFRQTQNSPPVTQRRVCRMVAGEREVCKIQQVQVCKKLPSTACENNFGVQLALRCNEAIDIPLIHLVE